MKKLFYVIVITLLVLAGLNLYKNINNKELANEVLISMYLEAKGGNEYDKIECCESTVDGTIGIDYVTYLDGDISNIGWVSKRYCEYRINEYNN